ncbi:MAG: hypothetical protein HC840_19630 [Leptolyngbyaceae cyanobacterium RM2_2_4]|nr:hypothetical protein [Leptolyngbyaceae cyanobacterium RM2_2_4]
MSLGCDVEELAPSGMAIAYWNDVPPPSQNLQTARNLILERVKKLVHDLQIASR